MRQLGTGLSAAPLRQSSSALASVLGGALRGQPLTIELLGDSTSYSQDTTATGTTPARALDGDSRGQPGQTRSSTPLAETLVARLGERGVRATVQLRAFPGDRTTEALTYHALPLAGTQVSLIQLALNDVANYGGYTDGPLTAEQTRANLVQLIEARLRRGVAVLLCTPVLQADAAKAQQVRLRLAVHRELAALYNLPLLDWDALTASVTNRWCDQVHPSPALNAALATALAGQLVGQEPPRAGAGAKLSYAAGTRLTPTALSGPFDLPAGADWMGAVDSNVTVQRGQTLVGEVMLPASGASGIALVSRMSADSVYVFGDGYWLRRVGDQFQLLHVLNGGGFESLGAAASFTTGQDWRGMLRVELKPSGAGHTLRVLLNGVQAFETVELTEWTTYNPAVVSGARMYLGGLSIVG